MDMLASRLLQHGAMPKSFKLSTLQHRLPCPLPLRIPKPGSRRSVFQVLYSGPDGKGLIVGATAGGRHANPNCGDGASSFDFEHYMSAHDHAVNSELDKALTSLRCPERLGDAMRYYVLAGGNRGCSMVAAACCELVGGTGSVVLPLACAIEMIVTAMFIFDDMPCMDNAALRRGIPSCHVAFGESVVLQAGIALVSLAFEHVARAGGIPANLALYVVAELGDATGVGGTAAGQVADKENEGTSIKLSTLEYITVHKTARLLEAAAVLGAVVGGGSDDEVERLRGYARVTGLLVQVVNDVLDVTGTVELLGKATGEDAAAGKCTYVTLMGVEGARAYAGELVAQAEVELEGFDAERAAPLLELARFIASPLHRSARVMDRWQQPTGTPGIW